LSSFQVTEGDSILIRLCFGLSPSNVRDLLPEKSDHKRVPALDVEGFNGEKLRDPVRHDLLELLSGHGLEAAQKYVDQSASNHSVTQTDSRPEKPPPASTETSDEPAPTTTSHKQNDKLEWYGTWEND